MNNKQEVIVTDIQIPFWSMVVLMVKLAIASIPALFILAVIGSISSGIVMMLFSGGMNNF